MNPDEIEKLTNYLRGLFNDTELLVLQHPEVDEQALVAKGTTMFAKIERDEDEGELSYSFAKDIPDQPIDEMKETFVSMFHGQAVEIRGRKGKTDSAEIYRAEEFLGVLYANEGGVEGEAQVFNMAILDIDLEET